MTAITLLALLATAAPQAGSEAAPVDPAPAPTAEPIPSRDPERKQSLEPKVIEAPAPGRLTFDIDPIADGAIIAVSLGFALVLDEINATGEIRPQQIAPGFDRSQLLAIDRDSVGRPLNDSAAARANIGMFAAVGFAVADPILSGFREGSRQTALVDAFMYAETAALTFALTDMVKIAVRRPRPLAYAEAEANAGDPDYQSAETDLALSFFSLHSSMTAALGATATYLAFAREPRGARPWITLAAATALSTFVSIERVRAGKHFPTDVIAGSVAGAGVGILVPHLHRTDDIAQRRVWVGFNSSHEHEGEQRGIVQLSGSF